MSEAILREALADAVERLDSLSGMDPERLRGLAGTFYATLEFAAEEMEDMLPYVSDYFVEKWGYRESLNAIKDVLSAVHD